MEKRKTTVKKANGDKTVIKAPRRRQPEQLSRDERRSLDKKKRDKQRKIKQIIMSFILLVLVVCLGVVLSLTVFFKISKIEVTGDTVYSKSLVASKCGVSIGDNLFRVNADKVNKSLVSALPYIDGAAVKRKMPGTLIIDITAAGETAAVAAQKGFIILGSSGRVLDSDANMLKESVPLIDGVAVSECTEGATVKLNDEKKQEALLSLLEAVDESGIKLLTDIKITDISNIKLIYDGRITIKVGDISDIVNKLKRAAAAIEKENEMSLTTVGVLNVKTAPNSYFSPGADEETEPQTTEQTENNDSDEQITEENTSEND